jgi:hypothetical protein
MLARLPFGRPSHATVVAYLGLFVALGGTSAVALSGSNTVFSDDIANDNFSSAEGQGGLVASDLRAGSVTSSEVADGSLTGADVFDNTIAGADVTNNTLTTADIRDDTMLFGGLFSQDLRAGSVTSSEIADASLNDEDVGQATFVNLEVSIGVIAAQGCVYRQVTGVNAQGDHLLLTPNEDTVSGRVIYGAMLEPSQESIVIQACNLDDAFGVNDDTTKFNLLVFDAQ